MMSDLLKPLYIEEKLLLYINYFKKNLRLDGNIILYSVILGLEQRTILRPLCREILKKFFNGNITYI